MVGAMETANISWIRRALWQVGGADPQIIVACPRHERAKFLFIGLLHLLIAAAFSLLAFVVATGLFFDLLVSPAMPSSMLDAERQVAKAVAAFVGLFAFVLALLCLVHGMRLVTSARRFAARRSLALAGPAAQNAPPPEGLTVGFQFIRSGGPAVALGLLFAWMVAHLAGMELLNKTLPTVGLLTAMSLMVVLSPLAVASIWTSTTYDGLTTNLVGTSPDVPPGTTHIQSPEGADTPANVSGPSESDLLLEREFAEAFERAPGNLAVGRKLIAVRRTMGKLEQALAVYDALIVVNPNNVDLIQEKASLYRELGDEVRYRRTLDQADRVLAKSSFERNASKQYTVQYFELKDVNFFADFKWELQPRVNILLGRNGYGKSLLLRALVAMIQNDHEQTASLFRNPGIKARLEVAIQRGSELLVADRRVSLFEKEFGKMPVLAIPDIRYIDKSGAFIGTPREVTDLRSEGAAHFLHEESYEGLIVTFLYGLCLDYLENNRKTDAPIFALIEKCLQTLSTGPFRFTTINRKDAASFEMLATTEGASERELPLQKASQGTLSIIAIVGLIYRYLEAVHPSVAKSEVAKQRAVVVIDEIDAHLHPSWQQQIMPLFRDSFPNVQFIVTAHSPLVVAGALEKEVAVLRKEGNKFRVDVMREHFIGATSAMMYSRVFDIEEKDRTYKQLEVLQSNKAAIERDVRDLEEGEADLTQEQRNRLSKRRNDLYYVRKFEEVKSKRDSAASAATEKQQLLMQARKLTGQVDELSRELAVYKARDPAADKSASRAFFDSLLQPQREPAESVEIFAEQLAASGRNIEAAEAWSALADAKPSELKYWRELALESEKLSDPHRARSALERALTVASGDERAELLAVMQRLTHTGAAP